MILWGTPFFCPQRLDLPRMVYCFLLLVKTVKNSKDFWYYFAFKKLKNEKALLIPLKKGEKIH